MNDEWLTQSAKARISNLLESRFSESAERIEASLSKSILKRKTAKIFVSRLLEHGLFLCSYFPSALFHMG